MGTHVVVLLVGRCMRALGACKTHAQNASIYHNSYCRRVISDQIVGELPIGQRCIACPH